MADNVGYTPGVGSTVAADEIGGVLHQRVKISVGADGSAADWEGAVTVTGGATAAKQDTGNTSIASIDGKVPALGQALAAASVPVVLTAAQIATITPPAAITGFATETTLGTRLSESDFDTKTGSLTEAAPASDTASSGLNGRLQRIAQRITSLIALVPSALTGSGNFKVSLAESTASQAVTQATGTNLHMVVDSGTVTTVSAVTAITNALPAGTNNVGFVTPTPGTTGGWSVNSQTALTSTKAQIKGSAGNFGGYMIYNPNSTAYYVQVWDLASASVTVGTTAPTYVITVPATSGANLEISNGINHATGITVAFTTTPTGSGNPASALVGFFMYK